MDESQHKAVHGPALRFLAVSILLVIPFFASPAMAQISPFEQGDSTYPPSTGITPVPVTGGVQVFQSFPGAAAPARDLPPLGAPTAPSQKARSSAVIPTHGGARRAPGPVGSRFQLQYQGRPIETQFQRQQHTDGMPIDVYFYEVRGPDGRQYVQDGNPLWGRFVRIPAAGHDAGSTAKWWHMEWVFRDGRWEQSHLENVPVEGLSPATTRPAPRPKIPDDLGDLD